MKIIFILTILLSTYIHATTNNNLNQTFEKTNIVKRINLDVPIGTIIYQISATDNENDILTYRIEQNLPFSIDNEGNIRITGTLQSSYTYLLTITVSDGTHETSTQIIIATDKTNSITNMVDYSSEYNITDNMHGNLNGQLWFMQSQMHRPSPKKDEYRPDVIAYRTALLLFMMENPHSVAQIKMIVTNKNNEIFQSSLLKPSELALSDQIPSDDGRPLLTFSKRSWTGEIPWDFITPDMSIRLVGLNENGNQINSAYLNSGEITVGQPHEIMINNIDLGMLVQPLGENRHVYNTYNHTGEYALNYFQTAPISQYTVARYAPAYFPKVVLPDGTVYTEKSVDTNAGVYHGDMRASIAKSLVSMGINNANIGIVSTESNQKEHDRFIRQTVVHTARGRYTDPNDPTQSIVVKHGLSGGGGKLTLNNVSGNEFSHEYGHDFKLPHYPGGRLSIHSYMSGWSYDTYKNRFIGNLSWLKDPKNTTYKYDGIRPFRNQFSYNKDAMGGGNPRESAISNFTFYTPYSAYFIQNNIKSAGIIDDASPTGYSQWDETRGEYRPKKIQFPKPDQSEIPVMTLLGFYDPVNTIRGFIYPALYSNYGSYFSDDTINAKETDSTCHLDIRNNKGKMLSFNLKSSRYSTTRMNQFQVNLPLDEAPYDWAKVICNGITLASRTIEDLNFDLEAPVVIGREHGMTSALKQIRTFSQKYKDTTFSSMQEFIKNFNNAYAPAQVYTNSSTNIKEGDSYMAGTKYYIALKDIPGVPSQTNPNWLYLGDAQESISNIRTEAIGVTSINYTDTLDSSVYFYVPSQENRVHSSDTEPSGGTWHGEGYSTVTAVGINTMTGAHYDILLKGRIGSFKLDSGRRPKEDSKFKYTFEENDNPHLPTGEYDISFYAYGKVWRKKKNKVTILVEGTVVVKSKLITPDYISIIEATNTVIEGPSGKIDAVIRITERLKGNNTGPVRFTIPKNNNTNLAFDSSKTNQQNQTLENSLWTMEERSFFYIFKYNGVNDDQVFPPFSSSKVGISIYFASPAASKGEFPLTATILSGNGEINFLNGEDKELTEHLHLDNDEEN